MERFFECADLLEKNPRRGRPVREVGIDTIRQLTVSSYRLIYFIVDEERIDVLAVHHQKRQLPRTLITRRMRKR
ncbi:MAG: type II toxin-antitoxin system RelE/ParE family toxin [Flavobacteriales bacterium]|nr:type II toxin-antitoxin system RelE/ParE family toxin [Flavobacteriales bacterium]